MTNQNTADIFDAANDALIAKDWAMARTLLDELAQRDDNQDMFCLPNAYGAPKHIADRINAVNNKV